MARPTNLTVHRSASWLLDRVCIALGTCGGFAQLVCFALALAFDAAVHIASRRGELFGFKARDVLAFKAKLVTLFDQEGVSDALRLAADLRAAGVRVEMYPEADKLGKQFKYASARGLRFVTVVGGDERASGQVTVKNMQTGEQTVVARDQGRFNGAKPDCQNAEAPFGWLHSRGREVWSRQQTTACVFAADWAISR